MINFLNTQNLKLHKFLKIKNPFSVVFGLSRSIIAAATLITLLVNSPSSIFRNGSGVNKILYCEFYDKISLYCLLGQDNLNLARWISIAVLLLVISGFYPRWTVLPHWWISFSVATTGRVIDGGDQVASNLCFLFIGIGLFDARRSHWIKDNSSIGLKYLIACSFYIASQIQISIIYFDAFIEKLRVTDWQNGTAMYYILHSPYMGIPHYQRPLLFPVVDSWLVGPLTWSVLLLELNIALSIFYPQNMKYIVLWFGIFFHLGIIFLLGIGSFGLIMIAALIMLLLPTDSLKLDVLAEWPIKVNRRRRQSG